MFLSRRDQAWLACSASEGMLEEASAYTKVVPYNKPAELERAIEKNRNTACVIMEPVLANIGLVLPEKGYLYEVRKITEQNDIILIFDEVVTGFRLALGGASEFFGLKPDLATFAKALGNGLPIGAIAGKKEIMGKIAPAGNVYQASTFAGNPVSVVAWHCHIGNIDRSQRCDISQDCQNM